MRGPGDGIIEGRPSPDKVWPRDEALGPSADATDERSCWEDRSALTKLPRDLWKGCTHRPKHQCSRLRQGTHGHMLHAQRQARKGAPPAQQSSPQGEGRVSTVARHRRRRGSIAVISRFAWDGVHQLLGGFQVESLALPSSRPWRTVTPHCQAPVTPLRPVVCSFTRAISAAGLRRGAPHVMLLCVSCCCALLKLHPASNAGLRLPGLATGKAGPKVRLHAESGYERVCSRLAKVSGRRHVEQHICRAPVAVSS
jgi:hypothetical protein